MEGRPQTTEECKVMSKNCTKCVGHARVQNEVKLVPDAETTTTKGNFGNTLLSEALTGYFYNTEEGGNCSLG